MMERNIFHINKLIVNVQSTNEAIQVIRDLTGKNVGQLLARQPKQKKIKSCPHYTFVDKKHPTRWTEEEVLFVLEHRFDKLSEFSNDEILARHTQNAILVMWSNLRMKRTENMSRDIVKLLEETGYIKPEGIKDIRDKEYLPAV